MISGRISKPDRNRRIRFAIFIKVLFKLIDQKIVRDQAKTILHSCIKQNRIGMSKYASLMDAIELPLRGLVGDSVWLCAYHYTELYHSKGRYWCQQQKKTPAPRHPWDDISPTPWSDISKDELAPTPWSELCKDELAPTPWSELCKDEFAPTPWSELSKKGRLCEEARLQA
jgi:hypothetical protein